MRKLSNYGLAVGIWLALCYEPLLSYGFLSEFVSADGTQIRDIAHDSILATDVIKIPMWLSSSMPLRLKLCTGASTGYSSTTIGYQAAKASELLSDMDAATSAWANVGSSGSILSFGASAQDNTASCTGLSGYKKIRFATLSDPGIVAYTTSTYVLQDGNLIFSDSHIDFNQAMAFNTYDCDNAGSPAGSCSMGGTRFSFLGVLTHELGHLLGISHSEVNDDNSADDGTVGNTMATMFPAVDGLAQSEALETLEPDDQLGKLALYPSSAYPSDTGGTISGYVRRANLGQRGAHVTAFDLTTHRTIAGAFSGVSGVRANNDGSFVIRGIPFDTDFALFVEPVDRTDVHPNLHYYVYNSPIQLALSGQTEGYLNFAVEGYPDVEVADVRNTLDYSSAPGFSSAHVFRLTSTTPNISNIVFFISNLFTAPNDEDNATLGMASYNGAPSTADETPTISNSNPLQITLTTGTDLGFLSGASLSVSATKSGQTSNWSGGVNHFSYSGKTSTVSIHPDAVGGVADGVYTVTATLTHSTQGTFTATGTMSAVGWTTNAVGDSLTAGGGGGGGCALRPAQVFSLGPIIGMALFFLTTLILRRYRKKIFRF